MNKYFLLAVFLILCLIFANLITNTFYSLDLSEPKDNMYTTDEKIYLKSFYLQKQGLSYYQAQLLAVEKEEGNITLDTNVFAWRLPTIFFIWKIFAVDGYQIVRLFWFLTFISFACIFFINKKFTNLLFAFLGPILLLPYFYDALTYQTSFLLTEWWAWFVLIFALFLFIYRRFFLAWPFFLLSCLIREQMIIPIVAFFILSLFFKKHRRYFLLIILFFLLFFNQHYKSVVLATNIQTTGNILNSITKRVHGFQKISFLKITAFLMRRYPLIQHKINQIIILISALSLTINILKKPINHYLYYFLASSWSLFITIPFIITGAHTDYWGILFMPGLIATIPLIFSKKAQLDI